MLKAPNNLRIKDGKLIMANKTSVTEYLKGWQICRGFPDGTPVCLIEQKNLQKLYDEVIFYRELTLGA